MMIDFSTEAPIFLWTFDLFEHLEDNRNEWNFGTSVWKKSDMASVGIAPSGDYVSVDPPEEWEFEEPIRLERQPDGMYRYDKDSYLFEAVRTDTETHIVLTGNWGDNDGTGTFIALFPKAAR